ncbi:MAG: hypothetical protein LN575_06330, partial [Rickettsia endosymbiont of Gnoriste bilineata]|nr:hypothetical protein [Rickettsia endosymbiont of Gnoriste bilineata]
MYYQHILEILRKYDPHFDEDEIDQVIHLSLKSYNSHKSWAIAKIITSIYPDSNSIITALLFFSTKNSNFKSIKLTHSLHGTLNTLTKLFEIHNTHSNFMPQKIFQLLVSSDCNIAIRVLLIRFAYLLHNITSNLNISYWVSYEISKIYLPLFQEVTVEKIKIALQNFCFQILHPQLCTTITSFLNHTYKHYDQSFVQIIDEFHNILSHMNIAYSISGRTKSPYSIAQKIIHKSVTIEQLYDIIGIRIIVEKKEECYKVLNTIYKHYLHIPHRYKDLITSPRKNGYQSLHAVIKTKDSLRVEVQIRTKIMHNIAEYGSASHLQYKIGLINISQLLNKYMLQQLTIISMLHSSISYSSISYFFAQLFINKVSKIVLIDNGLLKIDSEDRIFINNKVIFISILSDDVISNSIHTPKNSIMINTNVSQHNDYLDDSAIVHDMSYDIFASNIIIGTSTPKFHHTDKINMNEVAQKLSYIPQNSDVSQHNDYLDD